MPRQLEHKVALVTGGSSGIGRATALAFSEAGAKLVIANRGVEGGEATARLIRERGGEAIFVQTDVTKSGDVEALIARAVQAFGRLDCAFNNAGTGGNGSLRTADHTEEDFDQAININLKGVWLCMKYELLQMLTQGAGAIVNNSSAAGLFGASVWAAYVASKHGVVGLTRAAAREYGKSGIRVNAMCPGFIRTPMLDEFLRGNPERETRTVALYPIGRVGTPEEVAEAVLWLCSDAASFITGHALPVEGGRLA
jgi:NAD(P)-dependent dehydrogenase (short-subunit alcohol dehydrogenase family)